MDHSAERAGVQHGSVQHLKIRKVGAEIGCVGKRLETEEWYERW